MLALLRVLLMIALAVVTVSTAQHAHAAQQLEAHAVHSGHVHAPSGGGEDYGGDHDLKVCCPSLSIHCGAGAVLNTEISLVERLSVATSQSLKESAELVNSLPEFEPPPPRA